MARPIIVDHPVIQHKLTLMRRRDTSSQEFRRLLREIGMLMAFEATRDLPLDNQAIETPIAPMFAPTLSGAKLCLVAILRAGTGLLDGMLEVLPFARVGHLGIYRDSATLQAIEYYTKLPDDLPTRRVLLLDPMLATGHSAIAAVRRLRARGAGKVTLVCLLAAPEGIEALSAAHPDVPIITAAIDSHLNEHGYIVPGLGDAGDRLFGTA